MAATALDSDLILRNVVTPELIRRLSAPIEESTGLPNVCYTSDAWLALERERVFTRNWMLAGFCRDIPSPGDAYPVEVGGMPLIVLRDDGGQVRVFHNVCRHRGAVLVDAPCSAKKVLTCPYHGWAYGLDGALRTRPHFRGAGKHEVSNLRSRSGPDLVPVRHVVWHDLIFVDIGGKAPAFEDHWAPFAKRTADYDFSSLRFAKTLTFDVKGNWKLIHENFYDAYHVPTIHPRLEEFSPLGMAEQIQCEGSWIAGTNRVLDLQEGRGVGMPYYPGLDEDGQRTTWFFHLFPTACFQVWADQLAVFQLHPVTPDRTIEHIHLYFVGDAATDPALAANRQSVYDMWDELNTEDFKIVENIQRARWSPGFDGGVLSPFWDPATQVFARLMLDSIVP